MHTDINAPDGSQRKQRCYAPAAPVSVRPDQKSQQYHDAIGSSMAGWETVGCERMPEHMHMIEYGGRAGHIEQPFQYLRDQARDKISQHRCNTEAQTKQHQ